MRGAIMQPTYLPWIGYFALMDMVDSFVLLDDVQFSKQSWQQRNRILGPNGPIMMSIPVVRDGFPLIKEARIAEGGGFPAKHQKTIEETYRKTPYFADYGRDLLDLMGEGHSHLCELNIDIIDFLRDALDIETPLIRASDLDVDGARAEHVANVCKAADITEYVSPPGAADYLDESDDLDVAGVPYSYFDYAHPEYAQKKGADFTPYMSVIDLLFREGPNAATIMRSGIRGLRPPEAKPADIKLG